jgi:hypothetical protein
MMRSGMKGLLLAAGLVALTVSASVAQERNAKFDKNHVCRGILTANWTEGVADGTPDDGTRLIHALDINSSCLFHKDTQDGKKIMAACRMGYGCEVRARVNGVDSDVYVIVRVYSARSTVGKAVEE